MAHVETSSQTDEVDTLIYVNIKIRWSHHKPKQFYRRHLLLLLWIQFECAY